MEKKLVRKDKKIFGVCGGLADYFGMDPTVIRIIFVVALVFFGSGVLLYLILALFMPEEKPS
jgi:phage shock protein PspC (stress-responsive transcriptional regulator)